ncbi:MAG: peptidoglycan DD-metalloendopeptidase family protein [Luminiphilus sp.]|nr:peptidoglycan DD-metalloendopeptidase family protein [Luminiphilus sp.]
MAALLITCASSSALAQTPPQERATGDQIKALRSDISAIQARLNTREQERDDLQDQLKKTERRISVQDQELATLIAQQRTLHEEWLALSARSNDLRRNQDVLSTGIEASIQQLWVLQQGGGLRVWLGEQNPQEAARHLAYYRLIVEEQRNRLREYQAGLEEIEENTRTITAAEVELTRQKESIAAQRAELTAQQASRQQTITLINDALSQDEQVLKALLQNEERLNNLLSELQNLARTQPLEPEPFALRKGLLPMPVEGQPANRFGAVRNADMRWRGWFIPSEQGVPVKAIHAGQVIFADWLTGQGLIVVIDHGEGWLSLYAQNHSLLRQVGERVKKGTIVGKTGNSGGSDTIGLYFEIRHNGKPMDPAEWLDS